MKIVEIRSPDVLEHSRKKAGIAVVLLLLLDIYVFGSANHAKQQVYVTFLSTSRLSFVEVVSQVFDERVGYVPVSIVVSINFLDVVPYLA